MGIRQQAIVAKTFRHHGQGIDNGTQSGRPADPKRARKAGRVSVFQPRTEMSYCGERKLGGRHVIGDGRMRGQETPIPEAPL